MPGVFLSYRREDSSGYTGRLFDILSARFGRENTYMDLDTIEGGDDFASVINQKIGVSDVLIAVIGDRWLTVTEANGARRLDNPHDFVRIEIAEALQHGIRVIPVLVGGASLPHAQDLPDDLRPLWERQAIEIRDSHFHQDAQQLTHVLESILHGSGFRPAKWNVKRLIPALLVGAAVIIGSGVLLFRERQPAKTEALPGVDAAGARADVSPTTPQADAKIAGKWVATVKYDWGGTYQEKFDFELDGQELSGTAGLLGAARAIQEGKVAGNRITFVTKTLTALGSDQSEDTHSYKGIIEGNAIRFTMTTASRAAEHTPIHFIATRVKDQ
jgi:hypothetical protein